MCLNRSDGSVAEDFFPPRKWREFLPGVHPYQPQRYGLTTQCYVPFSPFPHRRVGTVPALVVPMENTLTADKPHKYCPFIDTKV